jgi:DNA-binding transcriptional LysR family regulator
MTLSVAALEAFVAVAEERHFGRAAQRLSMTQPPLSRRIQALEREIGVQLLERSASGAEPTPAGRALLLEARRLLSQIAAVPGLVHRVADGFEGTLALGFTASVALGRLGKVLDEVERGLPGVEIQLFEQVSALQLEGLQEGSLDLGLIRPTDLPGDMSSRVVHEERLVLALPSGHELARGGGPVSPRELTGLPMITYEPGHAAYFADLSAAVLHGARPRSVQRVAQIHSMIALVAAGRGAAIVPETVSSVSGDQVVLLPLEGWSEAVVELHVVWRQDMANPAAWRALDLLARLQWDDEVRAAGGASPTRRRR